MEPIQRDEILPLGEYERIRPQFRARVIAEKKPRRIVASDILSATLENRDTVLLQIQEMLRAERITSEAGIAHEIETYNELLPGPDQISMTLFVEIADAAERERMLEALAGLERHVVLEVDGEPAAGVSKDRTAEGYTRTTAVHYFKFQLSEGAARALRAGTASAALRITHPAHDVRAALSPETLRALSNDVG